MQLLYFLVFDFFHLKLYFLDTKNESLKQKVYGYLPF